MYDSIIVIIYGICPIQIVIFEKTDTVKVFVHISYLTSDNSQVVELLHKARLFMKTLELSCMNTYHSFVFSELTQKFSAWI
jgi:hypothetical protein